MFKLIYTLKWIYLCIWNWIYVWILDRDLNKVERTKDYRRAMREIRPILRKEFPLYVRKQNDLILTQYYMRKSQLLRLRGVDWRFDATGMGH